MEHPRNRLQFNFYSWGKRRKEILGQKQFAFGGNGNRWHICSRRFPLVKFTLEFFYSKKTGRDFFLRNLRKF